MAALGAIGGRAEAGPRITHEVQLAGVSHHFSAPQAAGRDWNEQHDGLGVQRSRLEDGRVLRYSAGYMRDSHGKQGLYAGLSLSRHFQYFSHSLDYGIAPMLLWRTTRFDSKRLGPAPHRLVPALMPMLTYEHRPSGFGANITASPPIKLGDDTRYPALVFLQFTMRVR